MAARDILNLNNSLAPRLIRCLYLIALILIAIMVILGVLRGIMVMSRPPLPPPAVTGNASPGTAAPSRMGMMGQQQGMMRGRGGMMMERRFGRRPFGPFGIGRNPVLGGLLLILGALLRGAIGLLVVRILAEMGLAILAMPRRAEI